MKRKLKFRFIALTSLLTAVLLVFSMVPSAAAAQRDFSDAFEAADTLNSLGLFKGTGTDASGRPQYELERKPTRTEALVMLIRTLGKERAVISGEYSHPFTDVPGWADKYVGYAYENGLSNGVGGNLFGAEETAEGYTYLTFILRALGYSDAGGADFQWNNPFDLAREIGILPDGVDTKAFLRADVAMVSCAGLSARLKNSNLTLIETLISSGAVNASEADAAGFRVMDAGSDAFNDEQDDNFVNSGMMAWDKDVCYFVYAEQYVLDNSIAKEYHIVRKNKDGSADILYTATVGARISSLSVHRNKLYFIEDTPADVAGAYGKLMELDPASGRTALVFKSSILSYYTWYDGVFYVLYTNGNLFSESYAFASVGSNGAASAIFSGLTWNDTLSFRAYGQNGRLYIVKYNGSSGKKSLIEYDLSKKTNTVILSDSLTNMLFYGNHFYYSNYDRADEGIYTLWRIKLDAPTERMAVGNLPQAGELYFHNGKFYFRSYLLSKLLSMDTDGKVEVVKPYLKPDSAVCLFGQYALLPTAGLIVSNHCDADIMNLNTGELTPYGAYLGFTFWREGTPYDPGESNVWHEEASEQPTGPHGRTLRVFFAEEGLVMEYALVNPTDMAVKFTAMDWKVTCRGGDPMKFATFIDVDVAPNSEYVFSMVFPQVPAGDLAESGFNYSVQLRFN